MPAAAPPLTDQGRSPGVRVLGIAVFLIAYGTNLSTPFLVTYRERLVLGDSATMAIFTVYVAGILSILPFAGQLSDRYGRRAISAPFIFMSAAASIIMIFGRDSFVLLLVGRLFLGMVSGAILSIGAAWMQELLGRGREQRSAVVSTLLTYAGFGAGPLVSALILEIGAWPLVLPYLIHAALTVLIIPFVMRIPQNETRSSSPIKLQLGIPEHGRDTFRRVVGPAAIWVFSFPSTSFALFPVIVSDAIDGSDVLVAAISGTLTAWSAILARPLLPRLGPERTLHLGMVCGTFGYVLGTTAFASGAWGLVLPAAVLLGGASGLLTGGSLALLGEMAEPSTRGSINSTFYLLAYPGMAMPIVLTAVASGIGLTAALTIVTSLSAVATLFLITGSRWRTPSTPAVDDRRTAQRF